jgi:hypothetical protein
MAETERWFLLGDRVRGLEGTVTDTAPLIVEYDEAGAWTEDPRDVELVRAARVGELLDRGATRAAIGRLRARTLTYGEVEDALWALAEREGLHEYLPNDPEPEPCHCAICQLVVPLLHELAERGQERAI